MARTKIELNRDGVRAVMQSTEMKTICEELAGDIARRCGNGYSVNSMVGKTRANAEILAETQRARADNLKNNTILKAMRGGGK